MTLDLLRTNVATQNAVGIPSRIVEPDEAAHLVPGLRTTTVVGGAWCGEDGYFDHPGSVVAAFARGLDIQVAEVSALQQHTRGIELLTSGGPILTGAVVLAAGADSAQLLAPLGIELPIEREERHLFLSEPLAQRLLEPLVVSSERGFAAKQLADGRVLASDLTARDAGEGQTRWRGRIGDGIRALLPALADVDLPTLVSGSYDTTPDRQPILGPLPGLGNIYLAAGFSGHGFMIAPAVARIIADAIEGRRDPALDVLDLARFAEGRPVPEPQIV